MGFYWTWAKWYKLKYCEHFLHILSGFSFVQNCVRVALPHGVLSLFCVVLFLVCTLIPVNASLVQEFWTKHTLDDHTHNMVAKLNSIAAHEMQMTVEVEGKMKLSRNTSHIEPPKKR